MLGSEIRFPLQNRREESKRFFPLSFVCRCMRDPAHATSKRPFQGPGVSASIREPLARSASASPVFRSKAKGRIFRDSPFCFCMPVHEGLGTCDLKAPLPGAGGVCQYSRTARAQRECESRFPLRQQRENLPKVLPLLVLRLQSGCLRPRIFRIPWISRGSSGPAGRKRPDGVFCCWFGRPARRASVGGCCSAQSLLLRRLFRIRACAAPAGG